MVTTEMFESLASCFAFRCSAPLNVTTQLQPAAQCNELAASARPHEVEVTKPGHSRKNSGIEAPGTYMMQNIRLMKAEGQT
jgi:hypothetical protein